MSTRKVLVIDKEMDQHLGIVCNAALKNAGMDVYQDVNSLIYSFIDEWVDDEPDLFFDEDED